MPETNQANPPSFSAEGQPTLQQLVEYFVELVTAPGTLERIETTLMNAATKSGAIATGLVGATLTPIVKVAAVPLAHLIATVLLAVLQSSEPVTDEIGKVALDAVLGERPRRGYIPDDVGKRVLDKLAPPGGAVEPGLEGAARYVSTMVNLQMETWLLGVVSEMFSSALDLERGAGLTIKSLTELREMVSQVFGGSRITRRVLSPLIDAGIVTPAKWATNKQYRPELLSAGAALEAYIRGDWDFPRINEELGRQGFSAERIDVLVKNVEKRLALDEIFYRHFSGQLSDAQAAEEARALGYDPSVSLAKLAIEDSKRIDALKAPIVTEATANYINGDLDDAQLEQWVRAGAPNLTDAGRMVDAAKARRAVHVRRLSSTRLRAMVLDGVASVIDFRQALEREGYPPDDATLEELSLRIDLKQRHDLEQKHPTIAQLEAAVLAGALSLDDFTRAPELQGLTEQGRTVLLSVLRAKLEKQAADAAEKEAAAAARAAREAELEAKRARAFPALAEYRRAYVRGFIARDVYAAALDREKVTGDDAAFLLAGADADREQFLADEERAAQQRAAGDHRDLSVSQLEEAVLAGRLELSAFDAYLAKVKYDDADRRLLVQLLAGKLEDRAAAANKRTEADRLAALRQSSIGDWEHAVRLGARTIAQYGAFLEDLGITAPARALMLDVLAAQLAADTEARQKRDARDQAAQQHGLPLAQRRRAVIAGVRPKAFYADAIREAGWPVDDQLADLDLLDVEIAAAAAARARRELVVEQTRPSIVSVSQLEHAFVLGLLSADEFVVALEDRGASEADADLLLRLAVARVADVRAGAQLHDQLQRELAATGVSLADLETAVRRGIVTLDDYATDLRNRGKSDDAVALLRQLLEEQVGVDVDGLRGKLETALTKGGADFTLEEITASLVAGEINAATFVSALENSGAPRDAALVYARLRTATETT